MVERLFLAVPQDCLWFVIVVFPDHTHLLFLLIFRERRTDSVLLGLKVTSHFDTHSCIAVRSELRRVNDMIEFSSTIDLCRQQRVLLNS